MWHIPRVEAVHLSAVGGGRSAATSINLAEFTVSSTRHSAVNEIILHRRRHLNAFGLGVPPSRHPFPGLR
jgi:hypothetical protein